MALCIKRASSAKTGRPVVSRMRLGDSLDKCYSLKLNVAVKTVEIAPLLISDDE